MSTDEFDQLAIGYLHRELDSADFSKLQHYLEVHPEAAAKILQLADEELLLVRGLSEAKSGSRVARHAAPPVSKRLPRRLSRRAAQARNSFSPLRIAMTVAALILICFFVANSFQAKPQSFIATLGETSENTVLVHDSKSQPAKTGSRLTALDRIKTSDGNATIAYGDGTILKLDARTSIQLGDPAPGKRLTLIEGALTCTAAKQPSGAPFVLYAHQTESVVIGTVFKLSESAGTTTLQVDEGLVKLTDLATHQSVQCGAGEKVVADNKSKLAVINTVAEVAEVDTYSQEFPNESAFEKGRLDLKDAPPGGVGSVSEVPIPDSNHLFIMQSKVSNDKPLFVVHDDDVIHLTYRSERMGDNTGFELFLCIFPREGWATECNLISRVMPSSTDWVTVDLPLSKFNDATNHSQKVDGMVCRTFFVQTFNYTGIKVAKFWVTRKK